MSSSQPTSSTSTSNNQTLDQDEFIWSSPPLDTTTLTHSIKNLEQSTLHCPICHQFFTNAIGLRPCNHVFCSECIRKGLKEGYDKKRKRTCPVCHAEMKGKEENYLVPNWGLQSVINTYKDMRAVLYQYVLNGQDLEKIHRTTNKNDGQSNIDQDTTIVTKSNEEVFHCQNNNVSATAAPQLITSTVAQYDQTKHMEQQSKRPRRSCQRNNQPCYKEENMDEGAENAKYMIVSPPSTAATFQPLSSTTTSTTTTIATPTGAPSDSNVKMNHSTSSPLPTPVPTLHSFSTATNSQNAKPMKRIPPFRFHGTKRNQLIRWCQEHSLPINGSDDDRTWRLKNFADLWNAECDSMNPRPKEILIKQLKMRESTEKHANRHLNYNDKILLEKIKESRDKIGKSNNKDVTITSGSSAYDKKLESGFQDLIARLKDQRKGIKRKPDEAIAKFETSQHTNTSNILSTTSSDIGSTRRSSPRATSTASSSIPSSSSPPVSSALRDSLNQTQNVSNNLSSFSYSTVSASKKKREKRKTPSPATKKGGLWNCSMCTFQNKSYTWSKTKPKCSVCGAEKTVVELDC